MKPASPRFVTTAVLLALAACEAPQYQRISTTRVEYTEGLQRLVILPFRGSAPTASVDMAEQEVTELFLRRFLTGNRTLCQISPIYEGFEQYLRDKGHSGGAINTLDLVTYLRQEQVLDATLQGNVLSSTWADEDKDRWNVDAAFDLTDIATGEVMFSQNFQISASDEREACQILADYLYRALFQARFLVDPQHVELRPDDVEVGQQPASSASGED